MIPKPPESWPTCDRCKRARACVAGEDFELLSCAYCATREVIGDAGASNTRPLFIGYAPTKSGNFLNPSEFWRLTRLAAETPDDLAGAVDMATLLRRHPPVSEEEASEDIGRVLWDFSGRRIVIFGAEPLIGLGLESTMDLFEAGVIGVPPRRDPCAVVVLPRLTNRSQRWNSPDTVNRAAAILHAMLDKPRPRPCVRCGYPALRSSLVCGGCNASSPRVRLPDP